MRSRLFLDFLCKSFLKKGDEVIVPKFSFIIYRIYSRMNGAKVIYSKENNFTVSTEDILKKVTRKTKIVFKKYTDTGLFDVALKVCLPKTNEL